MLLRRVMTVSGWTFASRILGLIRDRMLGATFGATVELSAFMLAFTLPNLLRNLFGEGALSAAFIPRYVRQRLQDPTQAERFAGRILTRLGLLLGAISLLLTFVSSAGIALIEPNDKDTYKISLALILALPQLPYLIHICLCALIAGMLNGRKHFWVPASAPIILNLFLIAPAVFWHDDLFVLPYMVLGAGVTQLAFHLWALHRTGGIPPMDLTPAPEVDDLKRSFLPTLVASSAFQVTSLLDSLIAYLLVPFAGAVTVIYFANRLIQFPLALIGFGVGTAITPDLAEASHRGGWQATGESLGKALRTLLVLMIPAAFGLFCVADPLVRTVYQTGAFSAESAGRTVLATQIFALGLIPLSASRLMVRAFHANLDQRTPMRISLVMVAVNVITNLSLVLLTPLAEAGIVLGTVLCGLVTLLIQTRILLKRGAGGALNAWTDARTWLSALIMAGAVFGFMWYWQVAPGARAHHHLTRLMIAVSIGMLVYAATNFRALRQLRKH
jgi:putative peptidoglycan lipid II flippase